MMQQMPENTVTFELLTEDATRDLAQRFAQLVQTEQGFENGIVVYLEGDLGAGKSFFSRAFVQSFLPGQKVKSPTYTLVESYPTDFGVIHHFDLYRLCDPEELEFLAVRDLLTPPFIALVEWPSKGEGVLPDADIHIRILTEGDGRRMMISPLNLNGNRLVKNLA